MAIARIGVYIWVTWISKLLVGDASCEWAIWFKSHFKDYEKDGGGFDFVSWKIDHTRVLGELRDDLEAKGHTVFIEAQNSFRTCGSSGAIIAGKPDVIAEDQDGHLTIYDVKTGKQRDSDVAQVMIYMYAVPRAQDSPWRGKRPDGCLVYKDGTRKVIPANAIDDNFKENLFALLRRITAGEPASRVPSTQECGFCDLTYNDCSERI